MACTFSETVTSQCPCMAIMCKNESMEGVCVEIMAGEVKCKYLTAVMSKEFCTRTQSKQEAYQHYPLSR